MIFPAIQHESCVFDSVSKAPDDGAKIRALGEIALQTVVAQHDVAAFAITVRNIERDDHTAIGHYLDLDPMQVGQGVEINGFSIGQIAKRLFCDAQEIQLE